MPHQAKAALPPVRAAPLPAAMAASLQPPALPLQAAHAASTKTVLYEVPEAMVPTTAPSAETITVPRAATTAAARPEITTAPPSGQSAPAETQAATQAEEIGFRAAETALLAQTGPGTIGQTVTGPAEAVGFAETTDPARIGPSVEMIAPKATGPSVETIELAKIGLAKADHLAEQTGPMETAPSAATTEDPRPAHHLTGTMTAAIATAATNAGPTTTVAARVIPIGPLDAQARMAAGAMASKSGSSVAVQTALHPGETATTLTESAVAR